jgi:hypothetical protein
MSDRGYPREAADALVAPLAERLHIDDTGTGLIMTLRGTGVEQTVALLDAVTAVAISESARQPERQADQLRLTVLGARQEVGRTVVARGMLMKDETHLLRTGLIFSICVTLAGGAVVFLTRRQRVDTAAKGAVAPAPAAKPAKA